VTVAKVTIDGQVFDYDPTRMLNTEAIALQKVTGMRMQEWTKALTEGDAFALTGLVWLLWRRAGRECAFDEVEFDIGSIAMDDDEPEVEPGPTEAVEAAADESPA
jgi:hypothetical protein